MTIYFKAVSRCWGHGCKRTRGVQRRLCLTAAMSLVVSGALAPQAMAQFRRGGQPRPNVALIDQFEDFAFDIEIINEVPRARRIVNAKKNAEKAAMKQRLQLAAQRQKQEEACRRYLGVRINQMRLVCGLSDQQVKKLEVAGKGAFDRAMDKWLKLNRPQHFIVPIGIPEPVPAEDVNEPKRVILPNPRKADVVEVRKRVVRELVEKRVANKVVHVVKARVIHEAVNRNGNIIANHLVFFNKKGNWKLQAVNFNFSLVLAEPVWTKTIERVLSEKQIMALKTDFVERTAFKRRATVARVVSKIDAELFLSDAQRPQLAKVVEEVMSMEFVAVAAGAGPIIFGKNLNALVNKPLRNLAQRISDASVKAIFTAAQMNRWQDIKRQPVNAFGDPIGGWGGGGGFW